METISKLERAKKKLTPAEIRTLFADLAEPFVPGLGATRQAMSGNYGQAAVSGLLDFGGPIGKAAGLAAAPMMGAIKVFHGSPYKFDKFDMSKIGTGEGAQAYGHGLYFAESPGVAESYKASTKMPEIEINGNIFKRDQSGSFRDNSGKLLNDKDKAVYNAAYALSGSKANQPIDILAEEAESFLQSRRSVTQKDIEKVKKAILEGKIKLLDNGSIYEVNLRWPGAREATDPLSPHHFLDWDKPYAEQPQSVKDALMALWKESGGKVPSENFAPYTAHSGSIGQNMVGALGMSMAPPMANNAAIQKAASEALLGKGIPGIRYKDAGSRSNFRVQTSYKGEPYGEPVSFMTEQQALNYAKEQKEKGFGADVMPGTSNYVTFDDQLAEILRRNPGLL